MDAAPATEPSAIPPGPEPFTPVAESQRIEALDVVRGFALLGIFLMNIEWFNRPFATFNEGMPRGLTGLDWLASWFIAYFVQGKFWTIFSLLFGMGFAVMLVRAERAGREFTKSTCAASSPSPCSARCTSSTCGRATSSSATRWARWPC